MQTTDGRSHRLKRILSRNSTAIFLTLEIVFMFCRYLFVANLDKDSPILWQKTFSFRKTIERYTFRPRWCVSKGFASSLRKEKVFYRFWVYKPWESPKTLYPKKYSRPVQPEVCLFLESSFNWYAHANFPSNRTHLRSMAGWRV